jgi:hypothetical protein
MNPLISFEADLDWFNNLKNQIRQREITNIDLRYEWRVEKMSNFDEFPDNNGKLLLKEAINNDPHMIETDIDFLPGNFMINEGTLLKII